ncbi:Inosose isomerase [Gemmata sp. SH-PL17]|uniref:sugar phosphate isomerase/epimerase family protein n=1 Tax=Gemmata sp. SH-PL17 TaxID=1630693 RepID=UPI0004B9D4F8|nr:sugar phosphate isomerase/epimerase [Gemmata sp. SH-PL17]AMV26761.1 Inosose isomerase [Gemmata sp. SH-PL17]
MIPCISQVTTLPGSFADDVANYPAGGCSAIEVWLTKLEKHLDAVSPDDTRRALTDRGITLTAAAYQGGLLLSQGEQRKAHFEHFKRRLALCQQFAIPTLLLVTDFGSVSIGAAPDAQSLSRALVSLTQAAQWAASFDVRLALEFRGADPFCSCLDTALTLVEQCGEPNVGVCLDVFHYYKGPSKPEDLDRLTAQNLFHVQVCDVAGVPRELMTDSDRVMPGEGDFRLESIVQRLKAIGYTGAVSLELMNPVLWSLKATQVTELGMTSLQRLLK